MEAKHFASGFLAVSGGILAVWGFLHARSDYINLGLAGLFLAALIITLKSSRYVKAETAEILLKSHSNLRESLLRGLTLEGKAVFVPPYRNLPRGGLFLPLREDFDLDPARFDEETLFLTDVPDERAMGLLLPGYGSELLEKYEEHLEGPLTSVPEVESTAGAVLKSLGLAERVYIEENEGLRIIVKPSFEHSTEGCEKIPDPVCASILLGIAKASGEVVIVDSVKESRHGVEVLARKAGRIEEWM